MRFSSNIMLIAFALVIINLIQAAPLAILHQHFSQNPPEPFQNSIDGLLSSYTNPLPAHLNHFSAWHSEVHYMESSKGPFKVVSHQVLAEKLINQTITGHIITTTNPGQSYHTYIAPQGCPGASATSKTAEMNGCKIATNAGFFDMKTSNCLNNIITDSNLIQSDNYKAAGFGITQDDRIVIGYANKTMVEAVDYESGKQYLKQFVNGRGWIVKKNQNNVANIIKDEGISQSFIDLIAPRLAIGWDRDGNVMLFVVNGSERDLQGIDLNTFADLIIANGALEAINLDGGGSVTLIIDGIVCDSSGLHQNECRDIDLLEMVADNFAVATQDPPYERPVTSIVCLK